MHKLVSSSQVDKILAVLLLLAVLTGAYLLVTRVYLVELGEISREIEVSKRKQARVRSILASESELNRKIRDFEDQHQEANLFLRNSDAATASTELHNHVKNLIAKHTGARISSIKPYPVKSFEDYSETSLEISLLDVSHEDLYRLLYRIEADTPVVLVRELEVKVFRRRYKPIVRDEPEATRMTVSMVVSGYFRGSSGLS